MITEEKTIFPLVKKFFILNCDKERYEEEGFLRKKLKCYFKKDENNAISIYDKDFSVKCVFHKPFIDTYFRSQPSYINMDSFDCMFNI